ncbi:MAG: PAS domain-containing protein [Pseudomonadota bacterium]
MDPVCVTMTGRSKPHTALVLDDNPSDALLLKQMFATMPELGIQAVTHHSSQGVFPGQCAANLVLLAEDYANSELLQLLELIKGKYPGAPIILLSSDTLPASTLLKAAQLGLAEILSKQSLSRDSLRTSLGALRGVNESQPKQALIPTAPAPEVDQRPAEIQPQSVSVIMQPAGDKSMFNALSTGVLLLKQKDQDLVIASVNPAFCALEGWQAASRLGTVLSNEDLAYQNLDLLDSVQQIASGSSATFTEVLTIDEHGEARHRQITARNLGSEGFLVEAFDSTPNPAALPQAGLGTELWRHIVASYPELSALLDEEGNIVDLVSGDWATVSNDATSLKGQTLSSLVVEDQRQACRELLSKALNTGKSQHIVFRLELSDGPMWLHSTFSLLRTDVSAERYAMIFATDISDLYEQHESISSELDMMKEFARRVPFALAVKDSDGRFERANPYFLDLFGLRQDDVIGKSEFDLFDESLAAQLQTLDAKMQAHNDVAEMSIQVDPDDWMVYRFIKLPLHGDGEQRQSSFLLVLPSDAEDIGTQAKAADSSKKKSLNMISPELLSQSRREKRR